MPRLNVMKAINENRGKINTRYDLTYKDAKELIRFSNGQYSLIYNCFSIGYIQGMKAAKAEMRKGVK